MILINYQNLITETDHEEKFSSHGRVSLVDPDLLETKGVKNQNHLQETLMRQHASFAGKTSQVLPGYKAWLKPVRSKPPSPLMFSLVDPVEVVLNPLQGQF